MALTKGGLVGLRSEYPGIGKKGSLNFPLRSNQNARVKILEKFGANFIYEGMYILSFF